MSRGEILLPLVCLIVLATLAMVFWRDSPRQKHVVTPAPLPAANPDRRPPRPQSPGKIALPQPTAAPDLSTAIEAAPSSPTSWEDPFKPELWQSTGWTFMPRAMRSAGTATATFHRPYHKLMFECDIRVPETPGSKFELQLATRNAQVVMSLIVTDGQLVVVTTENRLDHVVAEKQLSAPLTATTPRQFRVVATGNRIVISWDRKRFLTTEQLASQSGREIVWSINTSGADYEIVDDNKK